MNSRSAPSFFSLRVSRTTALTWPVNAEGKPTSVYSAIQMMPVAEYQRMAREVFGLTDGYCASLDAETVLTRIEQTNTCSNLSNPVRVWVDEAGDFTIEVFEASR